METALKVFVTLTALALYASLWVPGARRFFFWKGSDITMGWVSRLGFTLFFGVPVIFFVIGAPSERYMPYYLGAMILGFVLAFVGYFWDWCRDRA